jgi:MFS family permease
MQSIPKHVLPVIVFAQFAGTSLWFAGNAVVDDLIAELDLLEIFIGFIAMAIQSGFIIGTLVFALLNIADRFSPVAVFLVCSIAGAALNLTTIWSSTFTEVMFSRIATGFFLAGIYPVGMKIASDWHQGGLGKALGYLVGALVLGTAFPHLLKAWGGDLPWRFVIVGTSVFSTIGGLVLFVTVKDGPYRKVSNGFKFKLSALIQLFKINNFRSAAFGYFGHMWELYTFWTFIPVLLTYYLVSNNSESISVSFWSFLIIGIGAFSCAIGGHLSMSKGSKSVALYSLIGSGLCCLLLPFSLSAPLVVFLLLMMLWGVFVIPDSPQFSTLVAQSAVSEYVGTGLTIVNSIGFAITIVSIQLVNIIWSATGNPFVFWVMLFGPAVGIWSMLKFQE